MVFESAIDSALFHQEPMPGRMRDEETDISAFRRRADTRDASAGAPWLELAQNYLGLCEKVDEIAGPMKLRLRDRGSYSSQTFRGDAWRSLRWLFGTCLRAPHHSMRNEMQ
jgi:hypothetical protein